ncbi:potassium/sodium hyperpolarization-activated cyclic nucleotide-gated channel 2-like [Zerene cesonia]|uniref:potassium/sodium hyperpolarization-activated cyclic nucleotide-gated channel 2-like n=1 Tax=Zerene cesonia TaxID=33412 RepID=UPI0018E5A3DA|nr:potassium/sodium hyperpolarization-activated cyclic nucleotide-gated channel 2-like [Zerene cesonia]
MLKNHRCTLGLDTNSVVLKKRGHWYNLTKCLRKVSQVSLRHPNTFDHYRSYSTVIAEQQRQIFEGGNYVIHPLSQISLIIDHPHPPQLHRVDILLLFLHATSLSDIIFKFNTSFPEDYPTLTRSYIWHRSCHYLVLFAVTMHWATCFIYTPVVLTYYWSGYVPRGYNTFLTSGDITNCCASDKYFKALFVCLSTFFGTGFSTYKVYNPDEFIIHSTIILYTSMFMVYTIVFLLKIYMTKYNSTMRYHGLINQVEAYMQQKQFPTLLKKRVFTFYTYKYEGKYYKEDAALDCLSDQLRHEIIMHTCNKFIHEVKLLKDLPANQMGELMSYLKPETYLANDLILRAGDIGDCMYFIAYGTVAIYSLKGAEIAHLEDGDYFGTVALLMKDSKRITTVIAVEITHLYRLDAPYFRHYLMSNKTIRERIETLSSKRMHESVVQDEEYRHQQEKKREENILTHRDYPNSQ